MCHLCDRKCFVVGSKIHDRLGLVIHENEDKTVETVAILTIGDDNASVTVGEVFDEDFGEMAYAEAEDQDAKLKERVAEREKMLREMGPLGAILGGMIGG